MYKHMGFIGKGALMPCSGRSIFPALFTVLVLIAFLPVQATAEDTRQTASPQQTVVPASKATPAPAINAQPKAPVRNRDRTIALFQFDAYGVDPKIPGIMGDMLHGDLARMRGFRVIGSKEVDAMLGYEQKKQLSGCSDTGCVVNLAGTLGADFLVLGSIGKLGTSYTITIKKVNIATGQVDEIFTKRIKGGTEEDFLDVIPDAVAALFPNQAPPKKETPPPAAEKAPAPKKEEKKAEAKADTKGPGFSHSGKFLLGIKGLASLYPFGGSGELFLGYGAGQWVEVGVSGTFSRSYGVMPRVQAFFYNPDGYVKPFVAVTVPYYYTPDGSIFGIGAAVGVQYDFHKMVGITADFGTQYFFVRPADYQIYILTGSIGLQLRF
jgi:hypothetical protein